jgi:hypothetical protein
MRRSCWSTLCRLGIILGMAVIAVPASAPGQDVRNESLGGYGASASGPETGMGMTGGTVIPYNGWFGGFMPSRMGGAASLSFRPFARSEIESTRPSFRLSPMAGGASSMSTGFAPSLGAAGMGGIGRMQPSSPSTRMGVMPPSFAYPFRQPPSLLGPSSAGPGMSM